MKYIPLNIKTEYDLLNSLIKIDELISFAKDNNIPAIGITDSNMFGAYDFIKKCDLNDIKPILGIEYEDIIVYAKNYDGYVSLCKIVSKRNIDSITIKNIKEYDENIIVKIKFLNIFSSFKYKDLFTYVYIKYSDEQERLNASILTDNIVYLDLIRYFKKSDKEYLKYIKLIELGKTIDDDIELDDTYFKEINNKDFIEDTYKFASLVNIKFKDVTYHIPIYKPNSKAFLRALAKKGLEKRLNGNVTDEYKERLIYELSVIEKMNFVDYFLIVYDFILFAKKNGIYVGPGRGSGAGSLVNYALGIINIDPLKYDLLFERFLNPDRITMPDIDVDFDALRREEILDYVTDKYGVDNTARIISFNTFAPKQAIRDISKVLNYEQTIIERLTKTIKTEKNFIELKENNDFMNIVKRSKSIKDLVNICHKICGLKKNTSITAAGVVISDIRLDELMPLYKNNNKVLTGYSLDFIESLGLLKMDFLSLTNLTTLSSIINDIKKDGIDFDINNIDLNDKNTLDLFKNVYTTGIFQFESMGMKNFLKTFKVDSFNALIDSLALFRPGPRDQIPEYIARKNGKKFTYELDALEPILKSTYGVVIYQEQVLNILRTIGGYSYSEADVIRRAMSKKKLSVIENEKEKFINGVLKHGGNEKIAYELYDTIVKFSGYGFNKPHSVVYSLIAFQMAYLKINYTKYFMRNILNMNKSSESLKEYINESKILGIDFDNISINESSHEFIIKDNKLVFPFTIIKSIAYIVSEEIEKEREKGKFSSFYDFMIRCYGKTVNKKIAISLIECGAFDEFNINKKQMVLNIDEVLNYVSLCKDLNMTLDTTPNLKK